MKKQRIFIQRIISVAIFLNLGLQAVAADNQFAQGVKEFNEKNYRAAVETFRSHLTKVPNDVNAYYYCGLAYQYLGQTSNALAMYRRIVAIAPNSGAGRRASAVLAKLDPKLSPPSATPATARGSSPPAEARGKGFSERIIEIPPRFGHSRVRGQTMEMARETVKKLPAHIYKLLDEGGATINIGPNIIDKWPGSGDGAKPGVSSMTMGEEPARCYGRDVHLYEAPQIRGTNDLGALRSENEMRDNLLHELGHAIDDCSGEYSKDPNVLSLHNMDVSEIPADERSRLSYYTQSGQAGCMEACAETTGNLLGSTNSWDRVEHFPRLKKYLKEKLKL